MREKKKPEATVIINDEYFFTTDGRSMALYRNGNSRAVGYYTEYAPMMRRIIYLNSVDEVNAKQNVNILEYFDILKAEREKVERLFRDATGASGSIKW